MFQYTKYAINEFILKRSYDFHIQKLYLKKIYQMCFFRRTHAFKIFFNAFFIIDSRLLKMKTIMLNCQFIDEKRKNFENKQKFLMNKMKSQNKKR